jgi:hypothetical protein
MGNRQNLPHSQLTETKPKNKTPSEKVISHFYRKKFARPVSRPAPDHHNQSFTPDPNFGVRLTKLHHRKNDNSSPNSQIAIFVPLMTHFSKAFAQLDV